MSSQNDGVDGGQSAAMIVVFAVVGLVVASVVGASVYYQVKKPAAPTTAVAQAPAAALPASGAAAAEMAQNAMDAASVKVENGVVKFYFASGKSDLAAGANDVLADVIKGAKEGKKLVISGYHDATGSAATNAELAKQRAFAVRDALKASGVADDKIELKKPEELKATGSDAQARRVEVALQ
jgi:outer membrane protein OmpA-like peptidoglycan-associated protein